MDGWAEAEVEVEAEVRAVLAEKVEGAEDREADEEEDVECGMVSISAGWDGEVLMTTSASANWSEYCGPSLGVDIGSGGAGLRLVARSRGG